MGPLSLALFIIQSAVAADFPPVTRCNSLDEVYAAIESCRPIACVHEFGPEKDSNRNNDNLYAVRLSDPTHCQVVIQYSQHGLQDCLVTNDQDILRKVATSTRYDARISKNFSTHPSKSEEFKKEYLSFKTEMKAAMAELEALEGKGTDCRFDTTQLLIPGQKSVITLPRTDKTKTALWIAGGLLCVLVLSLAIFRRQTR